MATKTTPVKKPLKGPRSVKAQEKKVVKKVAKPGSVEMLSFPAFDLSRASVGLYMIAVSPSEIFPYTKVSRADEDAVMGFQRALDAHRVRKISEYIADGKVVPGAIIISAQDSTQIAFNQKTGQLTFPAEPGFFLVIDGQHRLYGSVGAEKAGIPVRIPVCIMANLRTEDEVQYFIDINGNQKGVPKTLRIELTKFLIEEESIDGIRLKLFEDLNADPDSPLGSRLSGTKRSIGVISHVPFKAALDPILSQEPLKKLSYEKKKKLLNNFLSGIKANLDEVDQGRRLYQSVFFQAVFRVFLKACEAALLYHRNYTEATFTHVFRFLQDLNFDAFTGSNDETLTGLTKELTFLLELSLTTSNVSDELL